MTVDPVELRRQLQQMAVFRRLFGDGKIEYAAHLRVDIRPCVAVHIFERIEQDREVGIVLHQHVAITGGLFDPSP